MSQTIKLPASLLCMLFTLCVAAGNPVARKKAVVNSGKARFTMLTPEMIRIEYSEKEQFEDRATFVIQNREMKSFPVLPRAKTRTSFISPQTRFI